MAFIASADVDSGHCAGRSSAGLAGILPTIFKRTWTPNRQAHAFPDSGGRMVLGAERGAIQGICPKRSTWKLQRPLPYWRVARVSIPAHWHYHLGQWAGRGPGGPKD